MKSTQALRGVTALAVAIGCLAAAGTAMANPTPTPEKKGLPNSIAVIGDSISAGTGTSGFPGSEAKQNSWATGTNNNSLYQRILAINPAINGNNQNVSTNGARMDDAPGQANQLNPTTELVTLQMGGNDLCRATVAQMTSTSVYRNLFAQTLQNIRNRAPNALILIGTVPDIFNLWYVRGAPGEVNGQESSRSGTARFFWDGISVIPCQSLVTNPTSTSPADTLRRNQVRQRNIELNYVLKEECAKYIRCRFDDWATFDLSSNRDLSTEANRQKFNRSTNIADWGNYEGYTSPAQWGFVDDDVSTIDHFHPSNAGHRKLAEGAWDLGYQFLDQTAPTVASEQTTPEPGTDGTTFRADPPVYSVTWQDSWTGQPNQQTGIRGIEYRIHTTSGAGPWQERLGDELEFEVPEPGRYWVESRAFDVNGNRAASRIREIDYRPFLPIALTGTPTGFVSSNQVTGVQFTGEAGSNFQCRLNAGDWVNCASPRSLFNLPEGLNTFSVRQRDRFQNVSSVTSASWNVDTIAPDRPAITAGPGNASRNPSQSIAFSGEVGGTYECRVNGGDWAGCSSPFGTGALPDGTQRFEVRQTDAAGNVGEVRLVEWLVKTSVPARPTVSGNPTGTVRSKNATLNMSGEPGTTIECRLNGADWATCPATMPLTGLPEGQNRLEVRLVDIAGNQSEVTGITWTVDTTPPRLQGQVKASRSKKATVIRTAFVASAGKPARIEYSTAKKKPSAGASPARARTVAWKPSVTVRGRARITWVRVFDQVGNGSPWAPVR